MESSSCISPKFYVIVRHVVYCIDVIISLLKCTYTKCLYVQKETNIPGSTLLTQTKSQEIKCLDLEVGTQRQILMLTTKQENKFLKY